MRTKTNKTCQKNRWVEKKMEFSVVIPIRGTEEELQLIPKTLPSYYAIQPSEVVLSVDEPTEDSRIVPMIKAVMQRCGAEGITRILRIKKGGVGWGDQQTKARRTGFLEAKYNKVLTGDIDLIINRNVLKAIELVGQNNIGLVSCSKFRVPHDFLSIIRLFGDTFLKQVIHRFEKQFGATTFTGLYSFWKPFWMEVEPIEKAKKFVKLKAKVRDGKPVDTSDLYGAGEDTFLRDSMCEKYECRYLKEIGGLVLTDPWEDRPIIQYGKGAYFAGQGRGLLVSLGRAIIRVQPYYMCGYLHARRMKKPSSVKLCREF